MNESTPEKKPQPELPEKPTPEQMVEVEKLLKQASVARIRGQANIAERATAEAAQVAPGSAAVRSALGDELWARGQMRKARDEYEIAHRLEPNNPTYETKWAEAVLGSGGDPLSMTNELRDTYASGKSATLLSLFVPGLGNMALGQMMLGSVLMAIWFSGICWLAAIPDGLYSVMRIIGIKASGSGKIHDVAMVPFVLIVGAGVWSLIATISKAKQLGPTKIERPTPPGQGKIDI